MLIEKGAETECRVERHRIVVLGLHDQRTRADSARRMERTCQCILQQVRANPAALVRPIDGGVGLGRLARNARGALSCVTAPVASE